MTETLESNKTFVLYFSQKANHQIGHILLTLKNGEKIKYTALYDSEEEAKIYTWEDRIFLGQFNQKDVLDCVRVKSEMFNFDEVIINKKEESLSSSLDSKEPQNQNVKTSLSNNENNDITQENENIEPAKEDVNSEVNNKKVTSKIKFKLNRK